MSQKTFDLNIEEVLENWEPHHALREIIANAIDEQALTNTPEIEIYKDNSDFWHVRDFGRGIKIEDFTLNENKEKLNAPSELSVIGKFGAGLKDALATLDRRKIGVLIRSPYGTYQIKREHKHGFDGIVTLHVEYDDSRNQMSGTEFILTGIDDQDMAKAKSLFLKFSDEQILESNHYGQIISRKSHTAFVYILGVLASEEPSFLFSYNITNLTDAMRKKLNRERLNVGRTTYADRVKSTLKNATSPAVKDMLIEEMANKGFRQQRDELSWIEISQMALTLMDQAREVVYFTEEEILSKPEVLDNAQRDGHEIVTVTEHQKAKLQAQAASGGPQVRTMDAYIEEYKASFSYHFVEPYQLSQVEKGVFDLTSNILGLVGLSSNQVSPIRISETIQLTSADTEGVWDESIGAIVIKRTKLKSIEEYAATLLHETAHAYTHTVDATRDFENVLTEYLGKIANKAVIGPQPDGREVEVISSSQEIEEPIIQDDKPFNESQVNENLHQSVPEMNLRARFKDLFDLAKTRKYLTYNDINQHIPPEMVGEAEIDELLMTIVTEFDVELVPFAPDDGPLDESQVNEDLYRSVAELKLSRRAANCLKNSDIRYIGELVQYTEQEMLRKKNFGRKSLNEITEILSDMGLQLGLIVPSFPSREELDNMRREREKRYRESRWR